MKASAIRSLTSVLDLPTWQVRWDSQVGLDLSFGAPRLEVREPQVSAAKSERLRAHFARRSVTLRGTHWLVVYPGRWRLELADGLVVRDTGSARKLDMAVARLKGEKLDGLIIDPGTGATSFHFDLGARLVARGPRGSGVEDEDELWSLHAYARYVSVYAGGRYATGPTSEGTTATIPIKSSGAVVIARTERRRRELLGMFR